MTETGAGENAWTLDSTQKKLTAMHSKNIPIH